MPSAANPNTVVGAPLSDRGARCKLPLLIGAAVLGLCARGMAVAEEGPREFLVDELLVVDPAPAPVPAMRYRLLPASFELVPGNAAPIYLRLNQERSGDWSQKLNDEATRFNELPADDLPLDELRAFVEGEPYMVEQLAAAARRADCDWEYTIEAVDPFMIRLPDVQQMRVYGRFLLARARYQIASGDIDRAIETMKVGMALGRNVSRTPFLVCDLVGIAIDNMMISHVQELISQPGAPNLYWALAALPRPLIDVREAIEFESTVVERRFPELANLDRSRSAEEWRALREKLVGWAAEMAYDDDELPSTRIERWRPFFEDADRLAAARRYLVERHGYADADVDGMSADELAVVHTARLYEELNESMVAVAGLQYWQAQPLFQSIDARLSREVKQAELIPVASVLMPSASAATGAPARLDQQVAMLQAVEAIRMHAAATGQLPQALDEITTVPVPRSVYTMQPFGYELAGDTAVLSADPLPGRSANRHAMRYRIRLRD